MDENAHIPVMIPTSNQPRPATTPPQLMRQAMEMAANPAARLEAMRNQDLALSQIEVRDG